MNSPTETPHQRPPKATKKERQEKLERLRLCKEKLSPEDAKVLREVFPDIFDDYYKLVWDYLQGRGLPQHDVEDLLQETFVLLYRHLLDNGFHDNLDALLKSFANGKVLNRMRCLIRSPISRSGEPTSSMETPTSGLDINRALDLRGFAAQVMPKLVDEHRAVIEAIILNGLSYCEAAEALNIPEGTLRSRFMAAKRVLGEHARRLLPPSQRGPR